MNIFEQATKNAIRFDTKKGFITTEDVWQLPLTCASGVSLDDLAKDLNKQVKEGNEESFVLEQTSLNKRTELKFNLVLHIIKVKLEERKTLEDAANNKAKKERIMAIISNKQDQELEGQSVEDLQSMLNGL